jgi:hypothetical protein
MLLYDNGISVPPRKLTNFRIEDDLLDALRRIKDRDGIPLSEQVRRALRAWIEGKGETVEKKADRLRVSPRKRP